MLPGQPLHEQRELVSHHQQLRGWGADASRVEEGYLLPWPSPCNDRPPPEEGRTLPTPLQGSCAGRTSHWGVTDHSKAWSPLLPHCEFLCTTSRWKCRSNHVSTCQGRTDTRTRCESQDQVPH